MINFYQFVTSCVHAQVISIHENSGNLNLPRFCKFKLICKLRLAWFLDMVTGLSIEKKNTNNQLKLTIHRAFTSTKLTVGWLLSVDWCIHGIRFLAFTHAACVGMGL